MCCICQTNRKKLLLKEESNKRLIIKKGKYYVAYFTGTHRVTNVKIVQYSVLSSKPSVESWGNLLNADLLNADILAIGLTIKQIWTSYYYHRDPDKALDKHWNSA